MKAMLALGLLSVGIISGSVAASGQKLYPVQGPLTAQAPPVVISGHIRRPMISFGSVFLLLKSFTFTNGEMLTGKCKKVEASSVNDVALGTPASYPPQPDFASAWDAVYGKGYFVAHVFGGSIAQGVFKGDRGTVLEVEAYQSQEGDLKAPLTVIKGVAVDNKGNTYKLVW